MTLAWSSTTYFEATSSSVTTGSPQTYVATFDIPTTAEACDRMLAAARQLMRVLELQRAVAKELARFLGANSSVWSAQRRSALRHLIAESDGAIEAVLNVVAETPRPDISDEAEAVLIEVLRRSPSALSTLKRRFEQDASAASRASVVHAVSRSRLDDAGVRLVRAAMEDDAVEVRDAAACALAHVGGLLAQRTLENRLKREKNLVVRESIQAALDDLSAG